MTDYGSPAFAWFDLSVTIIGIGNNYSRYSLYRKVSLPSKYSLLLSFQLCLLNATWVKDMKITVIEPFTFCWKLLALITALRLFWYSSTKCAHSSCVISAHSSLQNCTIPVQMDGDYWSIFKLFHTPVGFEFGLWIGHTRTVSVWSVLQFWSFFTCNSQYKPDLWCMCGIVVTMAIIDLALP